MCVESWWCFDNWPFLRCHVIRRTSRISFGGKDFLWHDTTRLHRTSCRNRFDSIRYGYNKVCPFLFPSFKSSLFGILCHIRNYHNIKKRQWRFQQFYSYPCFQERMPVVCALFVGKNQTYRLTLAAQSKEEVSKLNLVSPCHFDVWLDSTRTA